METMYYIGPDVHKRKISYCVKDSGGKVYAEGRFPPPATDFQSFADLLPKSPE